MEIKEIAELLGTPEPSDERTNALLEDAVAGFASNRAQAAESIRQLQAKDPSGFIFSAVRLLTTKVVSPGLQFAASLIFDVLMDALIDSRMLTLDAAKSLARSLVGAEPLLDVRLVTRMMARAGGDIRAVDTETALRILAIAGSVSDCSRLSSHLVQLSRHPSPHLRSKVALLLGRANLNLHRVTSSLASEDARLRANAIESLWGSRDPRAIAILEESSRDRHHRVSINSLAGLCLAGDAGAQERLKLLASSSQPVVRAGAAWAMGMLKNPEFADVLEKLALDPEPSVRSMAISSLAQLGIVCA